MKRADESTPLSPSLEQLYGKEIPERKMPVDKRVFYLSIQAIINAIVIGFVAKVLVFLIALITNLAFYGRISVSSVSPAGNYLGWMVVFVPVAGSIVVGLMARYGSTAIRGHGIPEAMEKIILGESKIPPIITFLKPVSAAISIGTGGPFGAEGPIIATGGAFGSLTGQVMHISHSERKIMLAAGACAGMSAIFGSPLAAILLAIELLLFEFSPRSIIPVALGCITGAGMHLLLFESAPVFAMPAIPVPSDTALIVYALLGLITGVIAAGVSKSVYWVEDVFEKIPVHWMWWPAIGAVVVGIVGYFAPFTMGVGYDNIQHLLTGNLPLSLLLSLCFLKYISWVIALGSGTSGGTLAPLFTIGGAAGALLGIIVLHYFPSAGINIATAALIGMAAMFAGASRAFLTSVVFALETTGQVNGLLPLIGACAAAYFVSFFLMKGSIMTEKIERRGIQPPHSYEPDILHAVSVKELMTNDKVSSSAYYVAITDDAGIAAEQMGKYNVEELSVIDNGDPDKIIGTITAASILRYYSEEKQKEHKYESPRKTRELMVTGRKLAKKAYRK
ncbi:MAG: chloride channel protein [Bacteroidetes bacterium]|nr:chloride channel protein [Bacteroidota bacterium]MBS1609735.1 chloride channel protein [Bacteroidota bacterium]